ncbi:alpha/beta hydrolase [Aeromonas caviae]|uniref:alpha/beta hydrolase n=1 Tax=Aeromonas caviae TaxID=648 RepID=UPI003F78C8C0
MFIVTNRMVNEQGKTPSEIFGEKPAEGPNELRLAEARRQGKQWQLDLLPDQITAEMAASVGLDPDLPHPASAYVARKLLERCAGTGSTAKQKLKTGKHLLLFVHGFNNDLDDVLERAAGLEARYGVEVLCFSWPANGGGARGVLSYKSDKRDALASAGALDRVLEKMKGLLDEFNGQYVTQLEEKAQKKFADNGEAWDRYFAKEVNKRCPFTINLLLHSMGNYLFKHLLGSTTYHANQLLFDNIIMAAADTNNELHAQWVDRIQCRNRLYITINERDGALMASRMKMGEQQKARLGHYTRRLDARTHLRGRDQSAPCGGLSRLLRRGCPRQREGAALLPHRLQRRHRRERGAVRCGPEPLSPLATAQKKTTAPNRAVVFHYALTWWPQGRQGLVFCRFRLGRFAALPLQFIDPGLPSVLGLFLPLGLEFLAHGVDFLVKFFHQDVSLHLGLHTG